MRRLYGLATLIGIATGAAYYLKKVGALSVTDEENEDGSRRFAVELKMPKAPVRGEEAEETEEVEETEAAEETAGEENAEEAPEEEEHKIGFTFEIGAESNARINEVKEKASQLGASVAEAAQNLKNSLSESLESLLNRSAAAEEEEEETEESFEEVVEEAKEAVEEAAEAVGETVEEMAEEAQTFFETPAFEAAEEPETPAFEVPEDGKSPIEVIDDYFEAAKDAAQTGAQSLADDLQDIDEMLRGLGSEDGQF